MIIYGNITLRDPKFQHHCTIPWVSRGLPTKWNMIAADAVDLFGLPGDRYITDIGEQWMTFSFQDSKDAVLFKLKFGEVSC